MVLRRTAQHAANDLHVYCQLRDLGFGKARARRMAGWFGKATRRLLYKGMGQEAMNRIGRYGMNLLILLSCALNAVFLAGDPHETLSARLGRAAGRGGKWGKWLHDILNSIDPGHCEDAARGDGGREV